MLAKFAYEEIKRRAAAGESAKLLAAEYEVSRETISRIVSGQKRNATGKLPYATWQRLKADKIPMDRWPANARHAYQRGVFARDVATKFDVNKRI